MNKLELAQDPNTSPEVLEELATDENYFVRSGVAQNPNCPITLLEKLATDEEYYVRYCVAVNPNCSIKLLEKIVTDEDYWVRYFVAHNPNCPEYIKTYIKARNFIEDVLWTNLDLQKILTRV